MRNAICGFLTATTGLAVSRLGQGIMSTRWDGLWAFVGVAALLGGVAITFARPLERVIARASIGGAAAK